MKPKCFGIVNWSVVYLLMVVAFPACAQKNTPVSDSTSLKMAFWNMENLMDTVNDPTFDDDFTPTGVMRWDAAKLNSKLKNMAKVIANIQPDVMGMCEVENESVLQLLLADAQIKNSNYGYVHFDSPDERGIDVALIYNKSEAEVVASEPIKVKLPNGDKTRDILYVTLKVHAKDLVHVFVNHWPSRREGKEKSEAKRIAAAKALAQFIQSKNLNSQSCVIMGDFNDGPTNKSIQSVLNAKSTAAISNEGAFLVDLNTMLDEDSVGTLKFGNQWDMFDQIIISNALYSDTTAGLGYKQGSFGIFSPEWLKQHDAKYEGFPFRTFGGKKWLNGYSDHFPVFAELNYE
ncbi:MAG: endonuclease/exonuclease/phosphatase family protein [Bacteroidia bacterium]|nr:endonuclease/exonuclease/phosphatase family protein [Bacteroidia bacterium]